MAQQELETRYAQLVCAEIAVFVYGDRVDEALARLGIVADEDRLADMVGGTGLRVADVRAESREVHAHGGLMWVDITVPSHFGCHAFELGADVQCEALDRVAGGLLDRKVVALSARSARAVARVGDQPSCALAQADLEVIAHGLDSVSTRMQRHFDHARALAEYLACCDGLVRVDYPGLATHPDRSLAERVLRHGFGPAVDFELPGDWGATAGDFIERCRLNGRGCHAGGPRTRLHARDGWQGSAVRIFAGLDDPLTIADDLDQAMRWFRNPAQP